MRIKLRTALVLGALVSTTLLPPGDAQAVTKRPGNAAPHKAKSMPSAQKSPAPKTTARNKSERVAHVVSKSAGKNASRAARAETAVKHGKASPLSPKAKVAGKAPNSEATRLTRQAKAIRPAVEVHQSSLAQRRNLTRILANNFDIWQEPGHLAVQSGSALVIGQDGGQPIYEKNANAVLPIASITKLMTAMVVLDSLPNLQAPITISEEDVDYLRGSRSRLQVGSVIPRETALLLALMSSENRAANALARHYPGGLPAFVAAMNRKAATLGMTQTHFDDPTGLNSTNVSTAHDLARMVAAAHRYPLIREFSTTPGSRAEINGRELEFHNTNQLVHSPNWEIGLSKTGYIQEAGKCLVMQARVADKPVVIVLLDSIGKQTRIGDANRIKRWMESASLAGRTLARV
ncbi:MAG: D-alanyl-D-alanine endopeptidase [Candidatus Accumulibacter sp.]|nr:D-alanyl-D-alanine endopeptidase [Accumulibacter sp.]